ncbi:MAG: iron ABC transporter permease [Enterobacterales bacterium]|nr:iron ABC transporter permease [Enterobacterales bacterium]
MSSAIVSVINPYHWKLVAALFFLIFSFLFALSAGDVDISMTQIFHYLSHCVSLQDGATSSPMGCEMAPLYQKIIWQIRLPRLFLALLTGIGLSICGLILQAITRNPLADPYLFGISSGASLGAVLVMAFLASAGLSITLGALVGGAFSVFLMLILAGRSMLLVERLVLSGVAVSFMLGAFTSLVLYFSTPEVASSLLFWMMGSFSNATWQALSLPALVILIGFCIFFIYRHWINALQAGDDTAISLGIPVDTLRLSMLLVCSAITAVLVAKVGGIGFVGLMIPHICRMLVGSQVNKLLLMCVLLGAAFMLWVDLISRSLLAQQVLPIGIVTSAVGSLFFFIILKTKRLRR